MTRHLVALLLGSLCASCGGGGGSDGGGGGNAGPSPTAPLPLPSPSPTPSPSPAPSPSPSPAGQFSVSESNISLTADDFLAASRTWNINGTVNITAGSTDTLYVLIEVAGPAVQTVDSFHITGNTGTATIYPQDPNVLDAGTFTSTITIRACLNSPTCATGQLTGSPRTVNVTYTVNSPQPKRDTVSPRFATSGQAGDVVLRGTNLAATSSVSFGSQPAQSFTVVSSTEIHARHPALAAGSQAVTLNGGTIPFTANLSVADPQTFAAGKLAYPAPAPDPSTTPNPVYDPERRSIYLALPMKATGPLYTPGPSRLLRYTYGAAGWSEAQVATIAGLGNIILGPTQASLLGFTEDAVVEIDPDTLAVTSTYPLPADSWRFPAHFFFVNNLTLTNDGYAVVTFGCNCGSAASRIYFFNTVSHQFRLVKPNSYSDTTLFVDGGHSDRAFVSGDGTRMLIGQYRYDPATGGFGRLNFKHGLRGNNVPPLIVMDRKATRIVAVDTVDLGQTVIPTFVEIYDGNYQLMGRVSEAAFAPTQDRQAIVSDDGSRLHVLHYDPQQQAVVGLSTYDISTTPATTFPLVGTRTTLPAMTHVSEDYGITLTPDGRTLLIAGDNGLFVQPLP